MSMVRSQTSIGGVVGIALGKHPTAMAMVLNFREQGGVVKLDMAMNPTGEANVSALNYVASPGYQFFGVEVSKPF